jgi:hypothetical protein
MPKTTSPPPPPPPPPPRLSLDELAARRAEFETSCASLELALQQWMPKVAVPQSSSSPSAATAATAAAAAAADDALTQATLSHAEAMRHAAAVFLAHVVLRQPPAALRVQTAAKQGLQACLRVVVFGGPMAALLWPLFHVACVATHAVDRSVARTVFRHLESRQGMQNIVHAWEIVEETWHRHDDGDMSGGVMSGSSNGHGGVVGSSGVCGGVGGSGVGGAGGSSSSSSGSSNISSTSASGTGSGGSVAVGVVDSGSCWAKVCYDMKRTPVLA